MLPYEQEYNNYFSIKKCNLSGMTVDEISEKSRHIT